MSQSDLSKSLRAAVEFDDHTAEQAAEPTVGASWLSDKGIAFADGARYENARLSPILSKLIAVVEAAEFTQRTDVIIGHDELSDDGKLRGMPDKIMMRNRIREALADLRAAVMPEVGK